MRPKENPKAGDSRIKKFRELLFSPAGTKILVFAGFFGIALIFLSNFLPARNPSGTQAAAAAAASSSAVTLDAYTDKLQARLTKIVTAIDGVGNAEVMVTFQSGEQNVYEQDQKQTANRTTQSQTDGAQVTENNDNEQQPVILNNDSGGQQALIKTQLSPAVQGVVVVCDGGDSAVVKEAVVNAVSTALDLSADHVCVIKKS